MNPLIEPNKLVKIIDYSIFFPIAPANILSIFMGQFPTIYYAESKHWRESP